MEETVVRISRPVASPSAPTPRSVLRAAQRRTLAEPEPRHGLLARALFWAMDLAYGKALSLPKFVVLELVARVPYQAWENVGYVAISHLQASPHFGRRIFEYVRESRAQQDNEQWHLFIMQELVQRRGDRQPWLLFCVLQQILAFVYYHISWLLYVLQPRWSYELNADFEGHAERSYMRYAEQHPELDIIPWSSAYQSDYGHYATVGDVLRRIALDERAHRLESLARITEPRFGLAGRVSEAQ